MWINLTLFGFAAGPVNVLPYISVAASLILFVVVSALALFLPRFASCAAVVAAIAMLLQPAWVSCNEKDLSGDATLGVPPLLALCTAGIHLWRTRKQPFLQAASSPPFLIRLCVAVIPLGFFGWYYDAPAVLGLLGLNVTNRTRPVYFVIPDGFRGEIRVEQNMADGSDPPLEGGHYTIRIPSNGLVRLKTMTLSIRKEEAFLSNGQQVPMLTSHHEQPEVIALRDLGMFDDAANNLPRWTEVYFFGNWQDAESLLNRYHENFDKVTPSP